MWRLQKPREKSYCEGRRRIIPRSHLCQVSDVMRLFHNNIILFSMINDGTEPFCGGVVCQKVSKTHNFPSITLVLASHRICRPVREQRPVFSVATDMIRLGVKMNTIKLVTRMEKTAHRNSPRSLA